MLQTNRQNDYSEFDFEFFKNNYNNNLINLANIQLNLLNTMPSNIDFISKLADKLSNLIVIYSMLLLRTHTVSAIKNACLKISDRHRIE